MKPHAVAWGMRDGDFGLPRVHAASAALMCCTYTTSRCLAQGSPKTTNKRIPSVFKLPCGFRNRTGAGASGDQPRPLRCNMEQQCQQIQAESWMRGFLDGFVFRILGANLKAFQPRSICLAELQRFGSLRNLFNFNTLTGCSAESVCP